MSYKNPIRSLSINGYKSIKELHRFNLYDLNILIGANGVGKSNFVSYFSLLREMIESRLQIWTSKQGGADRVLSYGVKETQSFKSSLKFARNEYSFILEPTVDGGFTFNSESVGFDGPLFGAMARNLGSGHNEAKLKSEYEFITEASLSGAKADMVRYCYESISSWRVYHFHDTSDTAGVKRLCSLHDYQYLRSDASNLAAFLYNLKQESKETYKKIVRTIQLAIPIFDEFILIPKEIRTDEYQIQLMWRQKNSDYNLLPSQLSDGSLRFICLVTSLLQPMPPSTIIIDEPELGLHPYAITLLGSLIRSASTKMQVIISTQSVPLLNEFDINDLIVVERNDEGSIFKRLDTDSFTEWLNDYTVGELWEKNILGGRP